MRKSIDEKNRFWKGFWSILGGRMEASWNQNGIKTWSYLENAAKQKVPIKPIEFQWFCGFGGHKLRPKIDPKSIKIWSPRWIVSWHRFLMDFSEFWEPSWEGKSIQDRSKIDPKGHQKNDRKKRASWKRLGGVLGPQNPREELEATAVAGTQRPLLRIP